MSELPQGWAEVELPEIASLIMGQSPPSSTYNTQGKGLPFYQGKTEFGHLYPTPAKYCSDPNKIAEAGDILISVRAPVGPTNLCREKSCIGRGLAAIRPVSEIPSYYLLYYLRSIEDWLSRQGTGSTFTAISKTNLEQLTIRLATYSEQRRIVAKLEKLLVKVDACQKRLDKIPILLKRFRQSILAAACSGRLTEDWRETVEGRDDLPFCWDWKPLESLLPPGGLFDGPFGSNLKTSDYTDSGVRVIRLENVGHLQFIGEKETYITRKKYEALKKHTVRQGDIIFASFIDDEIRACVLPKLATMCIAKADCFCLRPNDVLVDRQYFAYQLVSGESYNSLREKVHGATRPRINTTQLRKLSVRMCPVPEQHEIVRRVGALFFLADQIEARYTKAKAHIDKLTQSILAKAFRGELVPQDPNDEPAEELLKRIRAARATENKDKAKSKGEVAARPLKRARRGKKVPIVRR